jgi:hypothetical protein
LEERGVFDGITKFFPNERDWGRQGKDDGIMMRLKATELSGQLRSQTPAEGGKFGNERDRPGSYF